MLEPVEVEEARIVFVLSTVQYRRLVSSPDDDGNRARARTHDRR